MPQKKNLTCRNSVRGKVGRVNGHLVALLTLMKSQPLAYNKDNQEDKEPLFDTVDTVLDCLRAFADMVPPSSRGSSRCARRRDGDFPPPPTWRTTWCARGCPSGTPTRWWANRRPRRSSGQDLAEMTLATLQGFHPGINADVFEVLTLEGSVAARDHLGGTAPRQGRRRRAGARAAAAALRRIQSGW